MAEWPETPRLIGTRIPRLDGLPRLRARRSIPRTAPEGTLFGVMLYSPYAHAKVKSIDISAAEKMPGVKAVDRDRQGGATLRYHGDDIAAVAAETEEQARDAIRAIKVEYEVLPHVATECSRWPQGARGLHRGNVRRGRGQTKASPKRQWPTADVTIEGTYSVPVITHVCLEPHGLTVKWDKEDKMVAVKAGMGEFAGVTGIANGLGGRLQDPVHAT